MRAFSSMLDGCCCCFSCVGRSRGFPADCSFPCKGVDAFVSLGLVLVVVVVARLGGCSGGFIDAEVEGKLDFVPLIEVPFVVGAVAVAAVAVVEAATVADDVFVSAVKSGD